MQHQKELLSIENEIELAKLEEEAEKSYVNLGKLELTLHHADLNCEFGLSGAQDTDRETLLKDPELTMAAPSMNEHGMHHHGFPSLKSKANPTNKQVKSVTSGTEQIH